MTEASGYPHHLVGPAAPPPEQVEPRVLGMALKVHARHLAAVDHELTTAAPWRLAHALEHLVAEADAAVPDRNKASDGSIGDARHQQGSSDHNPGPIVDGKAIVRAVDITNDPRLNLPVVAERIRAQAAARLPQVFAGGYVILNGRITAEDWSGWRHYTGTDPHVSHVHVSSSRAAAQFDSRARWGVFSSEQKQPTPPPPTPSHRPREWTGPDLIGAGAQLRGQAAGQPQGPQSNGQRVADLQAFLRRYAPAYAGRLTVDGWYGPQTAAALREFAHRNGIGDADGLNIGPKLAAALYRAGLFRPLSAARARVLGHVTRGTRR